ncbi:MAG: NAD(P)-dependent dehydrogenase (short-subunit alcohol dehydrogenase family) [Planctomycetota bacterium]|jgi:NAD(P)-dependent dehydrogenase (short-subunit alcohol dehydrogenase family)
MTNSDSRLIVLTGATRGLGRALLGPFLAAGHRVIGCGRSKWGPELEAAMEHERLRMDGVDVADSARVEAWARETISAFGAPDLLINNAAVMNEPAPLWEVPADEFESMMAINVCGIAHVVRAFVPAMIDRGTGVIVNLSSGWGRSTSPEVGPYCTTKWAVEGFTMSLAQELPQGLAAVSLNPGIIDTEMLRKCWADGASAYESAGEWASRAADFLLELGPDMNGRAASVP